MFNLGTGELLIIFLVILLLFGAKRLPELARGLGKGFNEFKDAVVGQIWDAVNFDPSFYKMIGQFTDADIIKGLPPVQENITCTFSDEPVAYLSCNYLYFENFAAPMLRSLSDKAPGSHVHVHIMDVTPVQLAAAT